MYSVSDPSISDPSNSDPGVSDDAEDGSVDPDDGSVDPDDGSVGPILQEHETEYNLATMVENSKVMKGDPSQFELLKVLGQGSFGKVSKDIKYMPRAISGFVWYLSDTSEIGFTIIG